MSAAHNIKNICRHARQREREFCKAWLPEDQPTALVTGLVQGWMHAQHVGHFMYQDLSWENQNCDERVCVA